jgi:hypothetical protein
MGRLNSTEAAQCLNQLEIAKKNYVSKLYSQI